jgi:hypothetical protein
MSSDDQRPLGEAPWGESKAPISEKVNYLNGRMTQMSGYQKCVAAVKDRKTGSKRQCKNKRSEGKYCTLHSVAKDCGDKVEDYHEPII